MNTLWQKVSDEVNLPGPLTVTEFDRLKNVFDPNRPGSAWSQALKVLGLSGTNVINSSDPLLRNWEGTLYFNFSTLTSVLSHGSLTVLREADGTISYVSKRRLPSLFFHLRTQWRIEKYLATVDAAPTPATNDVQISESVLLGLVIQSLIFRLPSQEETKIARWLSAPSDAPLSVRPTCVKILRVQTRRNTLSPAWQSLFDLSLTRNKTNECPAYFWNEPANTEKREPAPVRTANQKKEWIGIPICPGETEGVLFLVEDQKQALPLLTLMSERPILVFARARPETTELFALGSGLLFGEGGALSHACSIAREQNVPCISALGRDFIEAVRALQAPARARINSGTGQVTLL